MPISKWYWGMETDLKDAGWWYHGQTTIRQKKALDFSYFLEHPSKIFDFALFWMAQCMFQMQLASHFNLVSMAFEII